MDNPTDNKIFIYFLLLKLFQHLFNELELKLFFLCLNLPVEYFQNCVLSQPSRHPVGCESTQLPPLRFTICVPFSLLVWTVLLFV